MYVEKTANIKPKSYKYIQQFSLYFILFDRPNFRFIFCNKIAKFTGEIDKVSRFASSFD